MCTNRESIGGGLRESPELRRDMACGGDGVVATLRWPSGVTGARVSHGVPRRWRSRDPAGWTVFGIPSGWTVFESPSTSTPWVASCRQIGHVRPRSRESPLHLPRSDLDSDGYSSQRPGPRAPAMPLEFLARSELRRRPAPLLAAAGHAHAQALTTFAWPGLCGGNALHPAIDILFAMSCSPMACVPGESNEDGGELVLYS